MDTPKAAFANDSKSFVITGLNEETGYTISDMSGAPIKTFKEALTNEFKIIDNGGIDIQNINVLRKGASKVVHFDQAALADIVAKGFDGQF